MKFKIGDEVVISDPDGVYDGINGRIRRFHPESIRGFCYFVSFENIDSNYFKENELRYITKLEKALK